MPFRLSTLIAPTLVAATLSIATASFAQGTYTGTTVGAPTFNRPLANGTSAPTALSGVGTAVHYSPLSFTASLTGAYTLQSTSILPAAWDNYAVLYSTSFNASAPLTNVLIANDDNPSIGTAGFTYTLTANATYVFVTTGFGNTDVGTFSNTFTGTGAATGATFSFSGAAAPEPGSLGLLGMGLFSGVGCMGVVRRRKAGAKK